MAEVAPPKVAEVPKTHEALRTQPAGNPARVVQIENPPPALLRLSIGQVVNGEVIDATKPGQLFLKAAAGILQATSLTDRLDIPNGSQLALKIVAHSPALRAALEILSRPAMPVQNSPHLNIADSVSQSQGVAARLLLPADPAAPASGKPLSVTLRGLAPASPGQTAAAAAAASGPTAAPGATTQPGSAAATGPIATTNSAPPPAQAAPSAQLQRGDAVQTTGRVVRSEAGRPAVLQTPLGRVETLAPLPLRAGESLQFTIELNSAVRDVPVLSGRGPAAFLLGQPWSSLDEAAALLSAESRQALATTPAQPSASQARDLPLLRLLVSMISGEPQPWQSAALVAGLQRVGRSELAGRIEDEQRVAGQAVSDDRGDWRLTVAPLVQDDRLLALRVYRRGPSDHDGEPHDESQATRFVVELDLSRYGLFQMDGLVSGKRFDLAIRSRHALSRSRQQDLRAIYETAIEGAGLKGQVLFDSGPDWRVMPLPGGSPAPVRATA